MPVLTYLKSKQKKIQSKYHRLTQRFESLPEAFQMADTILHQAAKGISDLINVQGVINLDFADVETIMKNMGEAIMGTGVASGEERAVLAAQQDRKSVV